MAQLFLLSKHVPSLISRSHLYTQLENALQKHFFAYSALIEGTLKDSTGRFLLLSVSKVKVLQGF